MTVLFIFLLIISTVVNIFTFYILLKQERNLSYTTKKEENLELIQQRLNISYGLRLESLESSVNKLVKEMEKYIN